MKKSMQLVVFGLAVVSASAENLYYKPSSDASAKHSSFGNYVYSSLNWTNAQGQAKYPADGDVLYYRGGGQMTAQGQSGYQATHLGGFVHDGSLAPMSQGELNIQSGGVGMVLTNGNNGTAFWYLGVGIYGSGEVPVYVHSGCTWSFQRYFWQRDSGETTLIKRGAGKLQFADGSGYAGSERGNWKETLLEAGTFLWSIVGTNGKVYNYPQLFPVNHVFTFADQGPGATFSIDLCDLELKNFTLKEASPLAAPNHVFTSSSTTNVNLRMVGTPGLNPMGFGGKLTQRVGLMWNPTSDDYEFVFSNSVSTTSGKLIVSNGTVRVAQGASFTQLSLVQVSSGKRFIVDAGAGGGFSAGRLVLEDDTAEVHVGKSVLLSFGAVEVNGAAVADGVYSSADLAWIKGEGRVRIGAASIVDTDVYWEREYAVEEGDPVYGPTELAANSTTNYLGVRLSGAALDFTAGSGAMAFIGAGGFNTAGDTATYTWGWPTMLDGALNVWNVTAGDTIEFSDDLSMTGGTKIWLEGGGTVQFTGAKDIIGDMEITNGTLIAIGGDALGKTSGKTTFHLTPTASNPVKGVLDLRCEPGKDVVNVYRDIDFHYWVTGTSGNFMKLPANATVNFYGMMRTHTTPLKAGLNGWPCHWDYSCPATTTVNWYGGMYARLNHAFPGGTHHVWKALTGGDRFNVGANAKVYLHVTGNTIGAATGGMAGKLYCLAPYALDSRSKDQLLSMTATTSFLDLGGGDQALSILQCHYSSYNGAKVSSDAPALLHVTRSQIVDNNPSISITNFVQFVGGAGVSMDRSANTYPLVLRNTSSSTGTVQVTSGILKMAAANGSGQWAGKWPNASAVVVKGGRLVLEHKEPLGTNTVMRISGSGVVEIPAGVRVKLPALEIGGVAQYSGTYGTTASGAGHKDDVHFAGGGVLCIGTPGFIFIVR